VLSYLNIFVTRIRNTSKNCPHLSSTCKTEHSAI
jgi:hypothetical protein